MSSKIKTLVVKDIDTVKDITDIKLTENVFHIISKVFALDRDVVKRISQGKPPKQNDYTYLAIEPYLLKLYKEEVQNRRCVILVDLGELPQIVTRLCFDPFEDSEGNLFKPGDNFIDHIREKYESYDMDTEVPFIFTNIKENTTVFTISKLDDKK